MDLSYHSLHLECPQRGNAARRCGKYGLPWHGISPPPCSAAFCVNRRDFYNSCPAGCKRRIDRPLLHLN